VENSYFSGKKVLVTGASGFIGSHLCQTLISCNAEVYGVSREFQSDNDICSQWLKGDLAEISDANRIIVTSSPDIVYHLASHVVGARDITNVLPTFRSNLSSTVNILMASYKFGCEKIVLVGSLEEPEKIATFVTPSSPYAAAKFASTAYGRMFHALYQAPVTIARLFMVYGPGQRDLNKLIPYVIRSLLEKKKPQMTSGQRLVDWIYVQDVVDGLLKMAQAKNIEGETIDIGSGQLNSVQSIVQKLAGLVDPSIELCFGSVPDRPMEQIRVADTEATYARIGWKPKVSLDRGLEATIKWVKKLQ
jgi:nucleoside-diphosphate-sugar epimerase